MIVDSHCHLDFDELSDLDNVLLRAKNSNVGILQTICTKLSTLDRLQEISESHDNIYYSVGVHPHEVEKEGVVESKELVRLTKNHKAIGIGETGLDYYYEHSNREMQKRSFVNHIEAARETKLPIIIHTRSAEDDTIAILKSEMKHGSYTGLIHCFTSTKKLAEECLEMGLYISVSGIITFKNATDLREVIKTVPLDRLLLETDAPYLAPVPMRGKANEPSFIRYTLECLAELLGVAPDVVEAETTNNFLRLFNKVRG